MFESKPADRVFGWASQSCRVILGLKQKNKTKKSQPKQYKIQNPKEHRHREIKPKTLNQHQKDIEKSSQKNTKIKT